MKRIILAIITVCSFAGPVLADPDVQILYQPNDLGLGHWQYTYQVSNINLSQGVEEFTIWFGYGEYQNLAIATPDPPAGSWDEVVWQPELGLGNGGYDALSSPSGIGIGTMVSGFSVTFDWLGAGQPGAQLYDIIDPADYSILYSGVTTVPEPATVSLIGLGIILMRKIRDKRFEKR